MSAPTSATAQGSASATRGDFVWYDLMTADVPKAIDFYAKVTGWGTEEWNSGSHHYTMWTAGGKPMGGVMAFTPDMPEAARHPHWMAYIGTPDVEATAAQAKSLGGRLLHGPEDIPTIGRFAVLADPQGGVFAIFSPSGEPMATDHTSLGRISWHELHTSDYEAAFAFYSALFGWEKLEAMDMGEMGKYQLYGRHGQQLGGMFNSPACRSMPPLWFLYASVDSADAGAERVKQNGGTVLHGPMDVPGGRIVQCQDSQGAVFALHSNTKPA